MILRWAALPVPPEHIERLGPLYYVIVQGPDLPEFGGVEPVSVVPLTEDPVCGTCPHLDLCLSSKWNEQGKEGVDILTFVHTCSVCGEHTLTALGDDPIKRVAPPDCRRWGPVSGCALPCNRCDWEWEAMRKAHPAHKAQIEAVGNLMASVFSQEGRGDAIHKMVDLFMPLFVFPGNYDKATKVLGALTADILSQERFLEAWTALPEWQRVDTRHRWLEHLYLALNRHRDDVGEVLREFRLLFVMGSPAFSRVWYPIDPRERQQIFQGWIKRVEAVLGKSPSPAEVM